MPSRKNTAGLRRSPLRFSLRSALFLMLASALALGAWRVCLLPFQRQQAAAQALREAGAKVDTRTGGAAWLRLGRDEELFEEPTHVNLEAVDFRPELSPHLLSLRRLESLIVSGEGFSDSHLHELRSLPRLRFVILDSTSVADDEARAFSAQYPDLGIHHSQARAISIVREWGGTVNPPPPGAVRAVRIPPGVVAPAGLIPAPPKNLVGPVTLHAKFGQHHFEMAEQAAVYSQAGILPPAEVLAALTKLTSLEDLDLSDAGDVDECLASLAGCLPHLKRLDLGDTKVSDDGLRRVAAFANLQELRLFHTPIGDAALPPLARLTNLEDLDLRQTYVGDAGIAHLTGLPRLKSLRLAHTDVTDQSRETLQRLTALRWLDVSNTAVTQQALEELEKNLPLQPIVIEH